MELRTIGLEGGPAPELHFNKHPSRPILLQSPTSLVALPDHVMNPVSSRLTPMNTVGATQPKRAKDISIPPLLLLFLSRIWVIHSMETVSVVQIVKVARKEEWRGRQVQATVIILKSTLSSSSQVWLDHPGYPTFLSFLSPYLPPSQLPPPFLLLLFLPSLPPSLSHSGPEGPKHPRVPKAGKMKENNTMEIR